MRFNRLGDLAGGVGNHANSLWLFGDSPRQIAPNLDGGAWLNPDATICRDNAAVTLVRCHRFDDWNPDPLPLISGPYSDFWGDGQDGWTATIRAGNFSTTGEHRGAPLPVRLHTKCWGLDGRDGRLLFQDFDSHVLVLWEDGELVDLGIALEARLGAGGVILRGTPEGPLVLVSPHGDRWTCSVLTTEGLNHPQRIGDWVSYAGNGIGRVLHRWNDATQGYQLTEGFSPDLVMLNGQCHPAVSLGAAELPSQLVRDLPVTLGQGMVSLEEPGPPIPPVPPDPTTRKPPYQRSMVFCTWQSFTGRTDWDGGVTQDPIGNMAMPDQGFAHVTPLPLIQMVSKDLATGTWQNYDPSQDGRTWAYLLHHERSPDSAEAQYIAIHDELPEKPIIVYAFWDEVSELPAFMNPRRTFPAITLYRNFHPTTHAWEPLGDYRTRVLDRCDHVAGFGLPWLMIPQAYDRSVPGGVVAALETVPVVEVLPFNYEWLIGILPFTDMRPGGMNDHQSLKDAYRAMSLRVPTRPNRYDYWLSKGTTWVDHLRQEKTRYTMLVLRQEEREWIRTAQGSDTQPPTDELIAPNVQHVVTQVRADHPEIDPCDEDSLDTGRAALLDWAAQRLNVAESRTIWGRKSRGEPDPDGTADRPNTDALAYLRPGDPEDRFELYDVFSGVPPCETSWEGFGPFRPGENGWWAPPQLPPEPLVYYGVVTRCQERPIKLVDITCTSK